MKKAIIFGGDSDIGRAIAKGCFNSSNWEIARRISKKDCDFTSLGKYPHIFLKQNVKEPVDLVVFAAGINTRIPFEEERYYTLEKSFLVNLISPLNILASMKKLKLLNPTASVIFIGSILGRIPRSKSVAYGISKGALEIATKYLAKELYPARVNNIVCGFIDTKWHKDKNKQLKRKIAKQTLMNRFGKVEEVAKVAFHLINNEYITGQSIVVDGGYSLL